MYLRHCQDTGKKPVSSIQNCMDLYILSMKFYYRAACNADAVLRGDFCLSVRLSVRPSVRLSVTRVIPDKTEERSVQIFIPYERTFSLVF